MLIKQSSINVIVKHMPNVIISVCSYVLLPYIFQGLNS